MQGCTSVRLRPTLRSGACSAQGRRAMLLTHQEAAACRDTDEDAAPCSAEPNVKLAAHQGESTYAGSAASSLCRSWLSCSQACPTTWRACSTSLACSMPVSGSTAQGHKGPMASETRFTCAVSHIIRFAGSPAGASCKESRCRKALPCSSRVPARAGVSSIACVALWLHLSMGTSCQCPHSYACRPTYHSLHRQKSIILGKTGLVLCTTSATCGVSKPKLPQSSFAWRSQHGQNASPWSYSKYPTRRGQLLTCAMIFHRFLL